MLDPEQLEENEAAAQSLRALAALAGEFFAALRDSGVPEAAAVQMLVDWHAEVISDGVVWEVDDEG